LNRGGLGAGGAAEPYAVSAANAIVYGVCFLGFTFAPTAMATVEVPELIVQLFAVVCVLAGAINNRIGLKWGLALGVGLVTGSDMADGQNAS
jgi:hypothetical protein